MRAVGYIRVSTEKVEQADSLENQKSIFLDYIKGRGFDFYDFYVDVASGTTRKRLSLEKLIADAEEKKFDIIIAKELSRLARNVEVAYELKRICETNGIHIITLDGALDTTDPRDNGMFGLYAWVYEQESQRIGNRIKAVFKSKYKNGEYLGSIPPYGYELKEKKLYLRKDDTPEIVKDIFNKFLDDWGYDKIARWLTNEGYKTPTQIVGKKNAGLYWHGSSIKKILKNPAYIGNLVQNRESAISVVNKKRRKLADEEQIEVKNTHEAIIDETTFKKVQKIIAERESNGRGKVKSKKHLFTNYLYCADCGTGLWYKQIRNSYLCGRYYKHGKKACSNHEIKEDELKAIILKDLKKFSKNLDTKKLKRLAQKKAEKLTGKSTRKLKAIEADIEKIYVNKDKWLDYLADGTIPKEEYQRRVNKDNKELQVLEVQKEELKSEIKNLPCFDDNITQVIDEVINFNDLNREMLAKLVERIEVKENGELVIFYKFSNPETHFKELAQKRAI